MTAGVPAAPAHSLGGPTRSPHHFFGPNFSSYPPTQPPVFLPALPAQLNPVSPYPSEEADGKEEEDGRYSHAKLLFMVTSCSIAAPLYQRRHNINLFECRYG